MGATLLFDQETSIPLAVILSQEDTLNVPQDLPHRNPALLHPVVQHHLVEGVEAMGMDLVLDLIMDMDMDMIMDMDIMDIMDMDTIMDIVITDMDTIMDMDMVATGTGTVTCMAIVIRKAGSVMG